MQTVASAAGTLSSIIFVLPGLIMIGWWTGFPFWISFAICALGGILGVMYSIPLRRALVTTFRPAVPGRRRLRRSAEGRQQRRFGARLRHRTRPRRSARGVVGIDRCRGVCGDRRYANIRRPMSRRPSESAASGAVSGYDFALSFALLAIGHLVGLSVGIAMLIRRIDWLGLGRAALFGARRRPHDGAGRARAKHLESQSPFPRRRRDRRLCNLDAAKTGKAGCERPRRRDGCLACAQSRQSRHAADHRARHSNRHRRSCHIGLHAADRLAARLFRQHERPRRASANARHRRRRLRRVDELLRLGGLRLHGGPDRFLQQPAVWHWHSGGDRRCVAARGRRKTVRVAGCGQGADGVRAFHHRGDLQRCRDREQ